MSERPVRNETLRETWFEAAHEILATEGYGALKLATVCKRLQVTTGAFYHSFDNWQDFTESLLQNWLAERTDQTVIIARETEDPVRRLQLLLDRTYDLLHRTEGAIRVWAGVDPYVGEVQRKVDAGRYQVVYEAMEAVVGSEKAEAYTVWGMGTLVGYEMMAAEHPRETLRWSLEKILADAKREALSRTRRTSADAT